MSAATKRTDELTRGDRVRLVNGAVRTVSHITDAGYDGPKDRILVVHYIELADRTFGPGRWRSRSNTSNASGTWTVLADEEDDDR